MLRDHSGTAVAETGIRSDEIDLAVGEVNQFQTLWCWAACMSMVILASDLFLLSDQCHLAELAFPGEDCCDFPGDCNQSLAVDRVAGLWQPPATPHCRALEFDEVELQLEDRRPVQIWVGNRTSCEPMDGGGHVVLAAGCFESGNRPWLVLLDPDQNVDGRKEVLLDALRDGASDYEPWVGSWTGLPQVREFL